MRSWKYLALASALPSLIVWSRECGASDGGCNSMGDGCGNSSSFEGGCGVADTEEDAVSIPSRLGDVTIS